ncbi:lysophosphatidylserine lipase ABHD12 isoform X2 [Hetaerina americana]|uniref:lysophosphatidylserine lipase ABHD12 isoform X2 n=1 Tax=Hetaerina americana TaxID=62018 RepID=UPI003A7F3105
MFVRRRKLFRRFVIGIVKTICLGLFLIFGIIPLAFRYSYTFQRNMLFLPFVRWPRNVDFNKPEKLGLLGARNFYVNTPKGISLGAWHILPQSMVKDSETAPKRDDFFEGALTHGQPIILYMHGNSGSRAGLHRIELYHVLQKLEYHIIAFDYRSYGDSSAVAPSEEGVVDDGVFMYRWTQQRSGKAPLFVWGHSLGTGISSHVLSRLSQQSVDGAQMAGTDPSHSADPLALVLESPFNNIRDEIREHPLAQFFSWMPWFDFFFLDPVHQNNLRFETDRHLKSVKVPIIILHAEDDAVVPYKLGRKLYHSAVQGRSAGDSPVLFAKFDAVHRYGHKYICRSPELPSIISKFFNDSMRPTNA